MKKTTSSLLAAALAVALILSAAPARGADSLVVCSPGVPFAYPGGGANILWNPDQGGLGPLTNAQAIAAVDAAFDRWENVSTSSATFLQGPVLSIDVDSTNFGPILNPVAPNGDNEIVFDEDGSIFAILFGPGSGILGFAGPDFGNFATCELIEGSAFLNGPAFGDALEAEDIMVHEFGHYVNLGHVELNGQLVGFSEGGDDSGPTPDNATFGTPGSFLGTEIIETMYPFYFGSSAVGTRTPHADDITSISTIYPDASYASTGSISGAILAPNGVTRVTGVNVIARNINNPFVDSVSTFSGAYTDGTSQADPNVGIYTLGGLTPGEDYAVFIDVVTALPGRFSNPITAPLPGPEEFWNFAESSTDPVLDFNLITASAAGAPGTDIIFNAPGEGDPLPVGDDGSVSLFLPFTFTICDQDFDQVFVNANGSLTFGTGDPDFSESAAEMLDGPPRIAGAWDDLNPTTGGSVYFTTTPSTFTVTWEDVPEWLATGSNTFSIELQQGSSQVRVDYGQMDMADGLAGVSCGLHDTGGVEPETVLNNSPNRTTHNYNGETAIYEWFSGGDNDLEDYEVKYNTAKHDLDDVYENNNSLATAAAISTPFNTAPNSMYTDISPAAADIDFFSFTAEAGQYIIAETTRGQIDSVLGLFNSAGVLIAADDDGGTGLLSRIEGTLPADDTYTLAVTFCCDYDFDGVDPGQGLPFDEGRYVLDLQVLDGLPLPLGDDTSVNLSGFGFSFPYDGNSYTDVFVNSNGNITFGAPDFDFSESVGEFENGAPRVAALWDDLNATGALVLASTDFATELTITFVDVPEFGGVGANNFAITLFSNGDVQMDYGSVTASDAVVGTAQGGGASSTATDFSATGGGAISNSPVEQFTFGSPFDLSNPDTLVFIP